MNISKLKALIPASFEYTYLDAEDTEQKETITLALKRMSFTTTASKTFREAMENEDTNAISNLLSKLIDSWNMDLDGAEFAPSAENIGACPADFVGQLSECVFKRLFPNPTRALPSPNGSEQTENSATDAVTNSESDSDLPKPADTGE